MQLTNNVIPFAYSRRSRGLGGLGDGSSLLPIAGAIAGGLVGGPAGAAAGSAIGGAAAGGGGAGAPSGGAGGAPGGAGGGATVGVSPTFQTQISPQISPVFQQSYMPQNSAMTAGTTQTMPTTQSATQPSMPGMPGALPGVGVPLDTSGFPSPMGSPGGAYATPQTQGVVQSTGQPSFMSQYGVWIVGGVAGLALLAVLMKKRK